MSWLRNLFQRRGGPEAEAALRNIQAKFQDFLALLEKNNQILKIISDMEEKSQGEYLLDIVYVKTNLDEVRSSMRELVERLISLGGDDFAPLRDRCAAIDAEVARELPGSRQIERDAFAIPFDQVGRDRAFSVGGKNAQLGEMTNLGLPVPAGFAISAWAYKHFLDANDLQARINRLLDSLDIKSYEELVQVGEKIQAMITSGAIPDDLADAIRQEHAALVERSGASRFAVRSSALGEDTQFSFAGQYATYLNVRSEEVVDRYRQVLASKFSPKAIYYFLSHDMTESELAMGVGCLAMVDAAASGVTYTRDPVAGQDECVLINAVFGLGKYLVDGTLTPDVFKVDRQSGRVVASELADKPERLVLDEGGGTIAEPVPASERQSPSIGPEHVSMLTEFALKLEEHYGEPQDIEWAIDRDGRLFLLQTRPLRVLRPKTTGVEPDVASLTAIVSGGTTVCPGAGGGPVHHARTTDDLSAIPDGAVLVAPNPFAGLITVMSKASAIVVETGGVASHMATIAREFRVPTLAGVACAGDLPAGEPVTVDATGATIYRGNHEDLIAARRPDYELFEDVDIFQLLERVLAKVSPLTLLSPSDPDFVPENCRTFHDVTRFAHQKAMEAMFSTGAQMEGKDRIGLALEGEIPLPVRIIYIDQDPSEVVRRRSVRDDAIASTPMQAFWDGIKTEGWPAPARGMSVKGFASVLATTMTQPESDTMSEMSFALLSKEYMILSLNLGYHFTTVEAMCSPDPSRNYIRMQVKAGGAAIDRRTRRIRLITDILSRLGFENASKGDFLDTKLAYEPSEAIAEKLRHLGRLAMMTKQLDMALSSDSITEWYTGDYIKKLGLDGAEERPT